MILYQLIAEEFKINQGFSTQILDISKNGQQMEEICISLNKKYLDNSENAIHSVEFKINEIDTTKVKDSLTQLEIKKLW
jgi:hypothetical protein